MFILDPPVVNAVGGSGKFSIRIQHNERYTAKDLTAALHDLDCLTILVMLFGAESRPDERSYFLEQMLLLPGDDDYILISLVLPQHG